MKLSFCVAALVSLGATESISSVVKVTTGSVQGQPRNEDGILSFLGIPFAAPPVGQLRWKSPQSPVKFNGTFNATTFGYSCYSALLSLPPPTPQNEDCLTINVWTGASSTNEKRPVMFWIYGGGFQFGSSADPGYNGTALAQEGVVVVSFNYRLGALGYLALDELDEEGTNSGNFGLQDQLYALQWVKENIIAFGGDPDNVTIWGESAGAHSVGLLMASPLSEGLFHKGIMESGAYWESEHGSIETFGEARTRG